MKTIICLLILVQALSIETANAQIYENDGIEDSLVQERTKGFLNPSVIYSNISHRTAKEKLVKELELYPINHRGGVDYYQIGETAVGMRFVGQYLSEISFRYFGDEGLDYESTLSKSGFLFTKRKKTSSLEIEPDFRAQTLGGEIRIYKKGNVVCVVYDGTYIGFTFHREMTKK